MVGGGIYLEDSQLVLEGRTDFVEHISGYCGGAVFLDDSSYLTVTGNASFESNSAGTSSGAIGGSTAFVHEAMLSLAGNTYLVDNRARRGGAASVESNVSLVVTGNAWFEGNTVHDWVGKGGVIYAGEASTVYMNGSVEFAANKAS